MFVFEFVKKFKSNVWICIRIGIYIWISIWDLSNVHYALLVYSSSWWPVAQQLAYKGGRGSQARWQAVHWIVPHTIKMVPHTILSHFHWWILRLSAIQKNYQSFTDSLNNIKNCLSHLSTLSKKYKTVAQLHVCTLVLTGRPVYQLAGPEVANYWCN